MVGALGREACRRPALPTEVTTTDLLDALRQRARLTRTWPPQQAGVVDRQHEEILAQCERLLQFKEAG